MRPLIVASLPILRREDLKKVQDVDADFVELRLDYLRERVEPTELAYLKGKVIVTLRDRNEGGVGNIDHDEKEAFLKKLFDLGVMYDVEESFLRKRKVPYEGQVVSAHYFSRLPDKEEVDQIFSRFKQAYTVKVAVSNLPGYRETLAYISEKPNATFMPMNVKPMERLAFALLGSKLLYTYVEAPTAQGQMNYKEAKRLLDFLFENGK
ncbi:type I 3-dehydroquinate dehydratase [Metallosphaera tengchongensis]|uniref:type I 3-dehydroquinate dehydratase n=1 Tax=Metallosphaera tengchongensis TaxID=1532350 RepID=UPI001FE702E4|nr:type I 3-dehydroquinate dehydratase [Metallosphaera tengchongensis]